MFRYHLHRTVPLPLVVADRGLLAWIMLNPSIADVDIDDPTTRRIKHFTAQAGFGELHAVNLFAYRSTSPKSLFTADDPVGPGNEDAICDTLDVANAVVVAYGAWTPRYRGRALPRMDDFVHQQLAARNETALCLGTTAAGHPRHPSRVHNDQQLVPFHHRRVP